MKGSLDRMLGALFPREAFRSFAMVKKPVLVMILGGSERK